MRDPRKEPLNIAKTDVVQFLKGDRVVGLRMALIGFLIAAVGFLTGYMLPVKFAVGIMFLGWLLAVGGLIYYFFERRDARQ